MLSSKTGLGLKALVAASVCLGSTSAMAASTVKAVRPSAVLTSAMTSAANPCPVGLQGCVLPLQEPVAPAPVASAPPAPAYIPPAASGGGFSLLPILAGLGLLGGIALLAFSGDDDGAISA